MKTYLLTMATALLLVCSVHGQAAKPAGLLWLERGVAADGAAFERYQVRCTDSTTRALTHWDEPQRWCVDNTAEQLCLNRKNKAMRKACKVRPQPGPAVTQR